MVEVEMRTNLIRKDLLEIYNKKYKGAILTSRVFQEGKRKQE
jgi:hypothetical protein